MQRRLVASTLAACLLVPCAAARASEVHVEGGQILYTAAPGETNVLTARMNAYEGDANAYYFEDEAKVTAGAGCQTDTYRGTYCQMQGPTPVVADLGDGSDRASFQVPGTIHGGAGDDTIANDASGPQTIDGGPGNDSFSGDSSGGDCFGRNGAVAPDTIIGGDGVDTVSYEYTVSVSLDGQANDGKAGEGDDVKPDVENITGNTCGPNVLTGSDGPNTIIGSGTLSGLGGNDVLQGNGTPDTLLGGDGDDRMTGNGGNDALDGGAGNDFLEGGADDDVLTGGPGTDSLVGDESRQNAIITGNDTINADDGILENVSCGPGADTANLDALDVVPVDTQNLCETVRRSGAAPGAPAGPGGPGTTPAAKPLVTASALKLVSQRRKLKLTLVCNATDKAGCNGTVRVSGTPKKGKRVTLATRTVSLATGKRTTLTLTISRKGRSLIKRTKKLPVTVSATLRTSAGTKTATTKLTLKR